MKENSFITPTNQKIISVVLRLSFFALFFAAAASKVGNGISGTIGWYESIFAKTWLPNILVTVHASVIMVLEFVLAFWLFSGIKLRWAWVVTALTLVSMAFGMGVAGKWDVANDNFLYVGLSLIGLVFSQFDNVSLIKEK